MTGPVPGQPDWTWQTPNLPSIHQMPRQEVDRYRTPFTLDELWRIGEFFLNSAIAQIAIAFGGIEIFGWKPFEFLVDWGNDLMQKASDAFLNADEVKSRADEFWNNTWMLLVAVWELLFGGNDYDPDAPAVRPWSDEAGAHLDQAWTAFWNGLFPPGETAPPAPATSRADMADSLVNVALGGALDGRYEPLGASTHAMLRLIDNVLGTGHSIEDLAVWLNSLLTGTSMIDAQQLFGNITVPFSSIVNNRQQLLLDPEFNDDEFEGVRWAIDPDVYRAVPGMAQRSRRVVANSVTTSLLSNTGTVKQGEKVRASIHFASRGLAGEGDLVQVSIVPFKGDDEQPAITVSSEAPDKDPALDGWQGLDAGDFANAIEAAWTVPHGEGFTAAALRITVTQAAHSGTVWVDSASLTREFNWDRVFNDLQAIAALIRNLGDADAWSAALAAVDDLAQLLFVDLWGGGDGPDPATWWQRFNLALGAIMELPFALDDSEAWELAWLGFVDLLDLFGIIDADELDNPDPYGFWGKVQALGDAAWALVLNVFSAQAWADATDALVAVAGYFFDTSSWGSAGGSPLTPLGGFTDLVGATTDLINALWEYVFGRSGQGGFPGFGQTAGENLDVAWKAFWAALFPPSGDVAGQGIMPFAAMGSPPAPEASKSSVASAVATGLLSSWFAPFEVGGWLNRLIEDVLILVDLFHFTYPVGDPGDEMDRKIGGKRTWWSAWNDLLDLFGLAKGAVAVADVGAEVATVDSKAVAAQNTVDDLKLYTGYAEQAAETLTDRIDRAEGVTIPALDQRIEAAGISLRDLHAAIVASYGGGTRPEEVDQTGYSTLINLGRTLQSIAKSGQTLGMSNSSTLSIRNNKPLYLGADPTSESSFPLPILGSDPPFFPITSAQRNIGFIRIAEDSLFNLVTWIGRGVGFTSFWVYVFRVDAAGNMAQVYNSPDLMVPDANNQVGVDTDAEYAWNYHELDAPFVARAGEVYGVVLRIAGGPSAAYNTVASGSWAPPHPYVRPRTPGMAYDPTGLQWGFAIDGRYEVEPSEPDLITASTFVRSAGEGRVLFMRDDPAGMFRMNIRKGVAGSNLEEIPLPAVRFGDALAVFADADDNFYFLQNTPDRTVQRVGLDGSATWMTVVTEDSPANPALPQENFSVGGMVVFPGGRIVLYDNDRHQLLSLDMNTFTFRRYALASTVDDVRAMCLNPQSSLLFMWNETQQSIIWISTRNYAVLGAIGMSLPSGFSVVDIAADADGFAYLMLEKSSLDGAVLARAHLGNGSVQFVRAVPTAVPSSRNDVLVSGTGRVAVFADGDFVAVDGDRLVVHENVHYFDVAESALVDGEPLPWFQLGTFAPDGEPPRFDQATQYPDLLVPLSATRTPIPDWCNTVFLVAVGGGGGGGGGHWIIPGGGVPHHGFGGHGGAVSTVTAYRGVHFSSGHDVWANIGQGGTGGLNNYSAGTALSGGTGGQTAVNIGTSLNACVAAGGGGGAAASPQRSAEYTVFSSSMPSPDDFINGHSTADLAPVVSVSVNQWRRDFDFQPTVSVASQQIQLGRAASNTTTQSIGRAPGGGGTGGWVSRGYDVETGDVYLVTVPRDVVIGRSNGDPGARGAAFAIFSQRIV